MIAARDPYAVTTGDPQRSKQQRCIARLVLAAEFLSAAMAVLNDGEAEAQRRSGVDHGGTEHSVHEAKAKHGETRSP